MRLGFFVMFLSYGLILPYLSPALLHVGYSKFQIGAIIAVVSLSKTTVPLLAGRLSDRFFSADRVVRFASFAMTLFAVLLWWQSGSPSYLLLLALIGLTACLSPCVPMMDTLAMQSAAGQSGEYARLRLVGSAGFAFAVTLFGYINDLYGIAAFFPAVFIACLIFALQSGRLPVEQKTTMSHQAGGFWGTLNLNWWLWLSAMILHWFCFGPYHYGFTLLLEEQSVAPTLVGWMWTIGIAAEITVFWISDKFFKRWHFHHLLILALGTNLVRWLLLGLYPVPWMIAVTQLMHGFGFALYYAAAIQGIQQFCGGVNRASYQGLFSTMVGGLASVLGTFASGWLHEQMPFREMILWFTPIQALAVIVLILNPLKPGGAQVDITAKAA